MPVITETATELTRAGVAEGLDVFRLLDGDTTAVLIESRAADASAQQLDDDRDARSEEVRERREQEFDAFRTSGLALTLYPAVTANYPSPFFVRQPTYEELWYASEDEDSLHERLRDLRLAENRIGERLDRTFEVGYGLHTDGSIEAFREYHAVFGELLGYPERCVEEFTDRKAAWIRAGIEFIETHGLAEYEDVERVEQSFDVPLAPEAQASRNDHEAGVWDALKGALAEDAVGDLVRDPPRSFYARIGTHFYPIDGDRISDAAIRKGREVERRIDDPEGEHHFRLQLVRNVAFHLTADYAGEMYVSQHTDFFEDAPAELDEFADAYLNDRFAAFFVDRYG